MLTSAANYYRKQRSLNALAVRGARKAKGRGPAAIAAQVQAYQAASVVLADTAADTMLAEQGVGMAAAGSLNAPAFVSDSSGLVQMIQATANDAALDRMVSTLVGDAGRSGMGAATTARPGVTGHIRYVNSPSCARCAILAGRFYRWSSGFQRHPHCDCQMVPSNEIAAPGLISDPMEAFEKGQIRGLSKADTQAILDGADLGRVVNVRRTAAGLTEGSSVLVRGGRLTPEGIYQVAGDRDEAVVLLKQHGYVTDTPRLAPSESLREAAATAIRAPEPLPAPTYGKTLEVEPGRRTAPLKSGDGRTPVTRDVWEDIPYSPVDGDFRYIANPDDRATGVLQFWTDTEVAAKRAALNIKAGRATFDGVDLAAKEFEHLIGNGYELADLQSDVTATAHKLIEWESTAADDLGTVYKGVQFPGAETWDDVKTRLRDGHWDYSSVTPRDEHAWWYAGRPDRTRSVIFEIEGAQGIRLNSVGDHAIEREFLVSGEIEIMGFEMRADPDGYGDRLYVKARQIR